MSATGRGAVRSDADYYPTPKWCVRRILEAQELRGGWWVEPGAGTGHIIQAVLEGRDDVEFTAVELREDCLSALIDSGAVNVQVGREHGDFLSGRFRPGGWNKRFDVAIGNPPFSLAQEFVDEGLRVADRVVFLLRLAFLESEERAQWWKTHPADVFVFPDRPSFKGKGTDSTAYAWFVWDRDRTHRGEISVLPVTSATEKQEDRGQLSLFLPTDEQLGLGLGEET